MGILVNIYGYITGVIWIYYCVLWILRGYYLSLDDRVNIFMSKDESFISNYF